MHRAVGSIIRGGRTGARFVSPAGNGRQAHPLSRGATASSRASRAARAIAGRDPLGATRRAARGLHIDRPVTRVTGPAIRSASVRWVAPRRELRDPRRSRAVPWRG